MVPVIQKVEAGQLQRAVHGVAGFVVVAGDLDPDGIAVVDFAFNRKTGSIHGEIEAFAGWSWDQKEVVWHLAQAEVLVCFDAATVKARLVKILPMVERKPWICAKSQVAWGGEHLKEVRALQASLEGCAAVPMDLLQLARAGIQLLGQNSPASGLPFFQDALRRLLL